MKENAGGYYMLCFLLVTIPPQSWLEPMTHEKQYSACAPHTLTHSLTRKENNSNKKNLKLKD